MQKINPMGFFGNLRPSSCTYEFRLFLSFKQDIKIDVTLWRQPFTKFRKKIKNKSQCNFAKFLDWCHHDNPFFGFYNVQNASQYSVLIVNLTSCHHAVLFDALNIRYLDNYNIFFAIWKYKYFLSFRGFLSSDKFCLLGMQKRMKSPYSWIHSFLHSI